MTLFASVNKNVHRRIVLITLSARICILVLCLFLSFFPEDYDSSSGLINVKFLYSSSHLRLDRSRSVCYLSHRLLKPLEVWDAVFFGSIRRNKGYEFEQFYAFFPGFPVAVGILPSECFLLSATLLNLLVSCISAVLLYELTQRLFGSRNVATLSCAFFALTPAGVFHVAPYSESLFTLETLGALYFLYCRGSVHWASLCVALSCATRSNGVVTCGFVAHVMLTRVIQAKSLRKKAATAVHGLLLVLLAASPLLAFQLQGWWVFCRGPGPGPDKGGGRKARPWCAATLPYVYGFVQKEYWNVGFLNYFTLSQLPNFLLAAPVLLTSAWYIFQFARRHPWTLLSGALPIARVSSPAAMVTEARHTAQEMMGGMQAEDGEGEHLQRAPATAPTVARQQGPRRRGVAVSSASRYTEEEGGHRSRGAPLSEPLPEPLLPLARDGCQLPETPPPPVRNLGEKGEREGNGRADGTGGGRGGARSRDGEGTGCLSIDDDDEGGGDSDFPEDVAVFLYPWAFLWLTAVFVMHVQVSTRMLSTQPQTYWAMATLWRRGGTQGKKRWLRPALLMWCCMYTAAGCLLYPNFYPWT